MPVLLRLPHLFFLVMISLFIFGFCPVYAASTQQLIDYTNQLIQETQELKADTLSSGIPKKQTTPLKNHLKSAIKHLKKGRKKLKKNKLKVAKKQFRKARRSVRRYIKILKRKVKRRHIDATIAVPLKTDAKILKRRINQLVHGQTGNMSPIANAGIDQRVENGQVVTLNACASSDADGDRLHFLWSLLEQPSASNITLNAPHFATPEFTPIEPGLYRFKLVVSDAQSSAADSVIINVGSENTAPVADAGVDQTANRGDIITLDASGSSDAEGDFLNYYWNLTTLPSGSNAELDDSSVLMPVFSADLPGLYQAELIVNDGHLDSDIDRVNIFIEQLNAPPIANAGADQSVFIQQIVTLDGSASSDVDGDVLSWFWSLTEKPSGSSAELDDDGLVNPTFIPDIEGQYIVQLIVDDDEYSSHPDSVIINVLRPNTLPVANAGPDQSDYVGSLITLDGSHSSDADNNNLSFDWSLIAMPSGSSATLDFPEWVNPTFSLDLPGNYVAQLIVNDGYANSSPDEIIISTINSRPVANAGSDQTITLGDTTQLNGSASTDADGQSLSYQWSISSLADGSTASLSNEQSINPIFTADLIGFYVFQLIVNDGTLESAPVTVSLQVNPVDILSLTLDAPTEQLFTNQSEINFIGSLNHAATLTINNQSVLVQGDLSFNHPVTLVEGLNTFNLDAVDALNTQVLLTRQVILDTDIPVLAQESYITVSSPDNNSLTTVSGQAGSVEAFAEVVIQNLRSNEQIIVQSDALGAFTAQLTGLQNDNYRILVQDVAGNQSNVIEVTESNDVALPPDPTTIAPPLNPTENTSMFDATSFLYSDSNPIQTGVNPADIEAKRVAVLRGKVLNRDNTPLSGVTIFIKDHPEFGQTLSRADGGFDMVVNGGGRLTILYQKSNYLPLQRKAKTSLRDYFHLQDVVMLGLDSNVTRVDLTSSQAIQIVQSSVQTDSNGSRQATLLFSQGTTASMILADGSTEVLTSLAVRATEYTVGTNGLNAMPGPLPPSSGYTYAVELSVDEALAAGATTVEFNQPVNFYVDNFLNFPVGEIVPVGYYDRQKSLWLGEKNGKIIKIISDTNGLANISIDPSGSIATQAELDNLGITAAEQTQLAISYEIGSELWRVAMNHFTPMDLNFPSGPPVDAVEPNAPEAKTGNENQPDKATHCPGCIIEAENQVLGERLAITATPYHLNYRSNRVSGNRLNRELNIPLSGANIPASLKAIDLSISIAGQQFKQRYPASANQTITWKWDTLDGFGRKADTSQVATIQIDYVYNLIYYAPDDRIDASFARFGRVSTSSGASTLEIIGERADQESKLTKVWKKNLGRFNPEEDGLGLWSLSAHHQYEPVNQILYRGDGRQRNTASVTNSIITTVAGSDNLEPQDNVPALESNLYFPEGIAVSSTGELYITDSFNYRIRKVDNNGIITTVAGNGTYGFTGDGGLAINAAVGSPSKIAIGPDDEIYFSATGTSHIRKIDINGMISTVYGNALGIGNFELDMLNGGMTVGLEGELYVADEGNSRIVKIDSNGNLSTVTGNGSSTYSGDGGSALEAGLAGPLDIKVSAQGELYILTNSRVRKVGTDGIITTIAGNGSNNFAGDGGLAVDASFSSPSSIALGTLGEFYITDISNYRIRKVGSDGFINTIAGTGVQAYEGDNGLAAAASLAYPIALALGAENELYLVENTWGRIRRISRLLDGFSLGDITIASEDAQQLFHFDASGRHIRTIDTLTGADIYTFTYTTSGLLDSITDIDGDITQIQRDSNGNPLSLIAPDGQTTILSLDGNGYLSNVTDPSGKSHLMAYDANGLMTSYSNPNNKSSTYQYDTMGRLIQDINSENGGWVLNRSDFSNGYNVTMSSAENRSTLYQLETLSTGNYQRQITAPNGTMTTQLTKTNGEEIVTHPNGTLVSTKKGPDPRFGMLAPVMTNSSIQTPAGLLSTSSQVNTANLIDSNDPLSISSLSETSTINGRISTSQYDASTLTWTDTSAANRISSVQINAKGRPVLSQVSGLESSSYSYDSRGRLSSITESSGALARNTQLSYYQTGLMKGYLQSITDAQNQMTSFEYDAVGRVTKQTLPDNQIINYAYDANGNLTSLVPPGRPAHIYQYDGLDQTTQYMPPTVTGISTPQTVYSYNLDKQLTQITRPDAQQATLNYGATSGKLDSMILPRGNYNYSYNVSSGQLSSVTAPDSGILSFSYDGFLNTQTQWTGEVSGQVTRSYDNSFRITSRSINGANTINYAYDNDSLLTQAGNLTITREAQKAGLINGSTLGNVTTTRAYNGFAELTNFSALYNANNLFETSYSCDKLGRITQKIETVEGIATTTDYIYDLAGRLVSESSGGNTITYSYDSNGNRTHINGAVIASYDDQDRLTSYNNSNYLYTDNGELLSKDDAGAVTQYSYDVLGNLTQVTLPDSTVIDYVIDGSNRRIGKKINGVLTQGFLYKDQLNPIAELDGNNQIVARYIYGTKGNVPDSMIKNGITYRIISDHLGSPRLIVDTATGDTVQQIDYDTWGNVTFDSNLGFQPFGFAGGLYDQHTQLIRFGARDYEAETARWSAKDPIRFEGGDANLYGYVLGDPVNFVDPLGQDRWPATGAEHTVGRPNTIIPPGGTVGTFIEQHVGSGWQFGYDHDKLVNKATKQCGIPDAVINIPSMLPTYLYTIGKDISAMPVQERPVTFPLIEIRF